MAELEAETLARLRALAKQPIAKRGGKKPTPPPYDEVYFEALRIMDEEDG